MELPSFHDNGHMWLDQRAAPAMKRGYDSHSVFQILGLTLPLDWLRDSLEVPSLKSTLKNIFKYILFQICDVRYMKVYAYII